MDIPLSFLLLDLGSVRNRQIISFQGGIASSHYSIGEARNRSLDDLNSSGWLQSQGVLVRREESLQGRAP